MILDNIKREEEYTVAERKIIRYILGHLEEMLKLNIKELAVITYSSPSTITRLCYKVGASGFPDFKLRIARELNGNCKNIDENIPFEEADTIINIATNLAELEKKSIEETYNNLEFWKIKKVSDKLKTSKIITLNATGYSYSAVSDFYHNMKRMGKTIILQSEYSEMQYHALSPKQEYEVDIFVSHSGASSTLVEIAELFKKQRKTFILVTAAKESVLAQNASLVLYTGNKERNSNEEKITAFSSSLSTHYIFDVIFAYYYNQNKDDVIKEK